MNPSDGHGGPRDAVLPSRRHRIRNRGCCRRWRSVPRLRRGVQRRSLLRRRDSGLRNEGKCHLQDRPCTEPTAAKPLEADSLLARGGRAPGPGVKNAHIHTRGRCAAMRPKGARRAAGSMHEYPGAQHGAAQHSQPRGPAELKTLKPHLRLRRDRTTRGDACDSPAARRYHYRHHHQVHARACTCPSIPDMQSPCFAPRSCAQCTLCRCHSPLCHAVDNRHRHRARMPESGCPRICDGTFFIASKRKPRAT